MNRETAMLSTKKHWFSEGLSLLERVVTLNRVKSLQVFLLCLIRGDCEWNRCSMLFERLGSSWLGWEATLGSNRHQLCWFLPPLISDLLCQQRCPTMHHPCGSQQPSRNIPASQLSGIWLTNDQPMQWQLINWGCSSQRGKIALAGSAGVLEGSHSSVETPLPWFILLCRLVICIVHSSEQCRAVFW